MSRTYRNRPRRLHSEASYEDMMEAECPDSGKPGPWGDRHNLHNRKYYRRYRGQVLRTWDDDWQYRPGKQLRMAAKVLIREALEELE